MINLLIRNVEQLKQLPIDQSKVLFCDTETYAEYGKCTRARKDDKIEEKAAGLYGAIRLVQLYQEGWDMVPVIDCLFVELQDILDHIQPYTCVFHNASYDLHTINCHTSQLWLPESFHDTMYLSRLTWYDRTKFDLYSCLRYTKEKFEHLATMSKKEYQTSDWGGLLTDEMKTYAACDVYYMYPLWQKVKDQIDSRVYQLDIKNLRYAVEYDRIGLPISRQVIADLRREYMQSMEKAFTGLPVNPNSPKQVCAWLNVQSSDKKVLGELALKGDDRAQQVLDARATSKMLNFIKKYDNDIIRGFHNPCGAITGRMSCTGGHRIYYNNTQQPPRDIFPAIIAPDGKLIIYKDYSGLELRMAVAFTGDPTLTHILVMGQDAHTNTTCIVFKCKPEDEDLMKRIVAKFCNFGIIYGITPPALRALIRARGRVDVSLKEVKGFHTDWLEEYHYFKAWHEMTEKHLKVYGYLNIETALGRKVRCFNLNDALNFPIQGSSAEVTKTAVDMLMTRYKTAPTIINVVHDSIALMEDEDRASVWKDRLNECMVDAWFEVIKNLAQPDIPMPAEAEVKKCWADKGSLI